MTASNPSGIPAEVVRRRAVTPHTLAIRNKDHLPSTGIIRCVDVY